MLSETVREEIGNIMNPNIAQTLMNWDTKEKSANATETDIYQAMHWCFSNPEIDTQLASWMQESAAFFVFFTQLRAMRGLVTNPTAIRR